MREVKTENITKDIRKLIANRANEPAWCIQDRKVVLVPHANAVDETICEKLGYEIMEAFYVGGVIVVNEGDVAIAHFGKVDNDFCEKFKEWLASWLQEKGLDATVDGNDVLVDGFKVCGTVKTRKGAITYTAAHISVNVNLDDIKVICTKPMKKTPIGLGEYGVTSEEIKDAFIAFCSED